MTYTCAICGGTFETDRPEEDVIEELNQVFGNVPIQECEIVCDDCYKKLGLPENATKNNNI